MPRKLIPFFALILALPLTLSGCQGDKLVKQLEDQVNKAAGGSGKALTADEIARAFKEALNIGSGNVVQQLGAVDGFNADPLVHIPLPRDLAKVKKTMEKAGLGKYVKDLELKLNRAAELAAPRAKDLFVKTIRRMSFKDVMKIYNGPENSATLYFQDTMTPDLHREFRPIVDRALQEVDAIRAYERLARNYNKLPFVKPIKSDVSGHVVERGIKGVFHYLGKEEAAIRKDPVRQTTDLLKRVFGGKR